MTKIIPAILMTVLLTIFSTEANIVQANPAPINFNDGAVFSGEASWYSEFSPGILKTTANMEIFDDSQLTCALWDVPFDTLVKVTNIENGRVVVVRVNDRGPAKRLVRAGRIIDLTRAAFANIADTRLGIIRVRIEILDDYAEAFEG